MVLEKINIFFLGLCWLKFLSLQSGKTGKRRRSLFRDWMFWGGIAFIDEGKFFQKKHLVV